MKPLFGRFGRDDAGSATVEFVLWLPMVFIVFALTLDVTSIFYSQTRVLSLVQDANRNASIGRLKTTQDVEDYVETALRNASATANATATITAGVISTTVTYPASDFEVIGLFKQFNSLTMTVHSEHLIEDWDA